MGKYVLAYQGAVEESTPEETEAWMATWVQWFGDLGEAVIDGGAPFGPSTALAADGSRGDTTAALTGFSVLRADSLEAAAAMAKGCPVLSRGGRVEVYETIDM